MHEIKTNRFYQVFRLINFSHAIIEICTGHLQFLITNANMQNKDHTPLK